ncbi:MAG TPA: glycoside hydrolase family 44 protein [Geobacteraceae bacterium]|nr:glycoside hydrolase family 44 protein [Geobacteraceae bacterium]
MRSLVRRAVRTVVALLFLAALSPCFAGKAIAADITIYGDSLASGWADDGSWSTTRNFANTAPVHGTSGKSISVHFDAGWAGLYLHPGTAIDMSGYGWELRFWIYGNTTGNTTITVYTNGAGCGAAPVATVANTWSEVRIPLSDMGNPATLTGITWFNNTKNPQSVFYLDDVKIAKSSFPPQPPAFGPGMSINTAAGRHPISADIYGMNYAEEQLAADLRLPVDRWGGNSTSRYNWKANLHNTGSDWYFENIPDGANVTDGSASDLFVEQDRRTGTRTLMTVPLIGWTPRSDSSLDHPYACGFKVSKYGAQQSTDSWDPDCGNGVHTNGTDNITGNDPTDTSTAIDPTFVTGWLNHLTGKYGTATNSGVAYYDLDNEPMLWNSTHRDVHPNAATYDEMRDHTYLYAAALKAADPSAETLGPVLWGWCAYFYSALDQCGAGSNDYNAHNNTYFVPWYLQQMKAYQDQHGTRILDYLDLHNYPAADSVSLNTACSPSIQDLRLRSTRSLWDTTYVDESWIARMGLEEGIVKLIPRMKDWVNSNYPGTKLAISEYNWGGLESINGAQTQADVLGIFGREGLDLATIWGPPISGQPGAFAFRIYRNYDGSGHGFGDISVQAQSADQSMLAVYAALRSSDNALTVVVINKTANDLLSNITLAGYVPQQTASVYRYSQADLTTIQHLADQTVTPSGFGAIFPGYSITIFVINGSMVIQGDFNNDGKPDILWQNSVTGDLAVWYMNGLNMTGVGMLNPSKPGAPNWNLVDTGDFNGDGKSDILWQNSVTGDLVVWYMDGVNLTGTATLNPANAGAGNIAWKAIAIGNFGGPSGNDILWQNSSTEDMAVWYMNGTTMTGAVLLNPSKPGAANWKFVGLGDFNNDGNTDILWQNSVSGDLAVWYMNGVTMTGAVLLNPQNSGAGTNWRAVSVGDYNNDGKSDILWQNSTTGDAVVWFMNGINLTGSYPLNPMNANNANWWIKK